MTPEERDRYSRQIFFHGIGESGQRRLLDARVAVVGCGALGSFHAAALARAGIGQLILIDRDYVEISNLQRQWLYEEEDVEAATPKAVAAARHIARINSRIRVEPVVADLTASNIEELIGKVDLVMDGADNFEVRYLVNDYAVREDIPWVYGAAVGSYGLSMSVIPGRTCCLKCIYPDPPAGAQPTCDTTGVVNAITSLIGSLQVAAALRILTGAESAARITTADLWSGLIHQIEQPPRSPECLACGQRDFRHLRGEGRAPISLCGRNAVQIHERAGSVDLVALRTRLEPLGLVRANEFALRFFLAPYEITIFPDGRAIIKGTQDIAIARTLYARYVGN
jgi:molybdopterin-synthase adenylyltransferase